MNKEGFKELENSHFVFEVAVENFNENQLNLVTPMFKCSLAQILYHLAYYETFYVRKMFRSLLYSKELSVKSFQDIDLSDLHLKTNEIRSWIYYLHEERINNLMVLDLFYSAMVKNKFIHEVHGELWTDDIVDKILYHDKHHCQQVQEISLWIRENSK